MNRNRTGLRRSRRTIENEQFPFCAEPIRRVNNIHAHIQILLLQYDCVTRCHNELIIEWF